MPATLVDKVRSKLTGDDHKRIAKRREVRAQIAELDHLVEEERDLARRIADIAQRIASAESAHRSAVVPGTEDDWLATAQGLRDLRSLAKKLNQERAGVKTQLSQRDKLIRELSSPPLANPQMLLKKHCATQALGWAQKRHTAAVSDRDQAQSAITANKPKTNVVEHSFVDPIFDADKKRDDKSRADFGRRLVYDLAQAEAEIAAAAAAVEEATSAVQAIRKQIVDE